MRTLTSPLHGQLWRNINIIFPHKWLCKRSPASYLDLLKNILSWAGDGGFRKIDIALNHDFLTQADFTLLLNASPRLEHLEVSDLYHFSLPSKEKIWNQLRHVTIDVDHFEPGQFPYRFLQNAASSLEHLTFTFADVPDEWYDSEPLIPHLPKLKSLRIGGWEGGTPFSMYPFAIAFPRIEQLWMGPGLPDIDPGPVASWRDKWEGVWPHLKFINIYPDSGDEIRDIFGNNHYRLPASDVIRHSDLRNLRSVRSNHGMWILPDRARIMLSKSIKNGQLTSFDITFPEYVPTRESSPGDLSVRHLKGYDWLRGAPSIHTLGLYSFHFLLDRRNYEDLPLPQFLATFPNLRTLRLSGGFVNEQEIEEIEEDEFVSVIVAIMSVTRLKTIHMAMGFFGHNSETLRKLRKAAHLKGVQISTADDYYPEQWPIPLGP
ncbi:uncharacterized protein CPUR_07678 [Claviceps purpurea 20.1]|uniref:F-box domain-containing protein n=1 Tax=Claviceps purpurea (strain 20.1) TaxID=1111077 RepID=M1VY50_CLAP2|nr:uncharacterized protein CPUR_07678 [Claviceps purpurea 20.1]